MNGRGPSRGRSRGASLGLSRGAERGQSLVEFTLVIPVFMVLLASMLEFGMAFSDRLTLGNATREGARIGAALVTGSDTTCTGDPAGVDTTVIASVQNILKSGGSDVDLSRVNQIRIYKSSSSGTTTGGAVNVWRYTPGSGPDADPGAGSEILDFSQSSAPWPACSRNNGAGNPDSIAVSIDYEYRFRTPLGNLLTLIGGTHAGTLAIVDTTIMALNPTR